MRIGATGPLPDDLPGELEALKLRLAGMGTADIGAEEAERLRIEISAIRLQLKRLAAEREDIASMVAETLSRKPQPRPSDAA